MAPVQKLGNIDLKKRTSQKFAFGFFTLLSYLVVAILFVILGFIIIKGGSVISWDFLTRNLSSNCSRAFRLSSMVSSAWW